VTKHNAIKQWIFDYQQRYGCDVVFSGALIYIIAEETQSAASTVYSTIRKLHSEGLMQDRRWVGARCTFEDVVKAFKQRIGSGKYLVHNSDAVAVAKYLFTKPALVEYQLSVAINMGLFSTRNAGVYGRYLLEVKA
jgi:hypothetical protein